MMKIDFHTHPMMIREIQENDPALSDAIQNVFGLLFPAQPLRVFILEMDAAGIDQCVLLPIDCSSAFSCKIPSNEVVAQLVKKNKRFLGFASVDPNSKTACQDLEFAIKELGLKGLKLDPALQHFSLLDENKIDPIFQLCSSLKVPVLIHCGLSWAPHGLSKLAHPGDLEETIQKHPNTNIVIAHLGWPWVEEAIMLAIKYENVYLDTSVVYSGTPQECLQHVIGTTIGKNVFERNLIRKTIYGSNYPRQDMRRAVRGFNSLAFSQEFTDNAFLNTPLKLLTGD
ncbi:MAG: amidohydrolase [Chloroflexi bacterium]|nr:amidohydrolase [Chloroflexota bacterium]